jgi:hypothetical protein
MESLQVRTGEVSLQILNDEGEVRGIFRFNPNDVKAAQNFLNIQKDFEQRAAEFQERAKHCESAEEQVEFLNELVDYFEGMIDTCFGEGSSQTLFGDAKTLSMFEDFFTGITPYYQKASEARVAKYGVKAGK